MSIFKAQKIELFQHNNIDENHTISRENLNFIINFSNVYDLCISASVENSAFPMLNILHNLEFNTDGDRMQK